METKLDEKQRAKVRNSFDDHPLLLMCDDCFLQMQRDMRRVMPTPEDMFCETAEVADRLLEDWKCCDELLPGLWDKLFSRYCRWSPAAENPELDMMVGCVYLSVITVLTASPNAVHYYKLANRLMGDYIEHYPESNELLERIRVKMDLHQEIFRRWVKAYLESEIYLSDEIAEVLAHKKKGSKGGENGNDTEKEFEPDRATFIKKGILDNQLALVQNEIYKSGWLVYDRPDDFISIFSGKQNSVTLVWRKGVGKGNLCALFEMMIKGRYIACPQGHTYQKMLKSHFVDEEGNYLTGLNSTYVPDKCQIVLDTCKSYLNLQNPGVAE